MAVTFTFVAILFRGIVKRVANGVLPKYVQNSLSVLKITSLLFRKEEIMDIA